MHHFAIHPTTTNSLNAQTLDTANTRPSPPQRNVGRIFPAQWLEGVPPEWRELDLTEERKRLRFALEQVFEDGLMSRRETRTKGVWVGILREDNGRANIGYA